MMPPDTSTHDDQVTAEIPAVGDEVPRRDSVVPWLIAGGIIGIVALVIFAGGLREPGASPGGSTTTTSAPTVAAPIATATTTSVPAPAPATVPLEVRAIDPQGVAIELRRAGPSGTVVFAGTLAQGTVRRFAIPQGAPLWLSLAWAPSAAVRVDGVVQDTSGGTEAYLVTQRGIRRLTLATRTSTTSR